LAFRRNPLDFMPSAKTLRVAPARVHLTGPSMGGYGTWACLAKAPELFASGVPICGGGDPATAAALKDLPVWAFHGEKDTAVPVAKTREMEATILKAGGKRFRATCYPDEAHESWTPAHANPALLAWMMLQQKKEPRAGGPACSRRPESFHRSDARGESGRKVIERLPCRVRGAAPYPLALAPNLRRIGLMIRALVVTTVFAASLVRAGEVTIKVENVKDNVGKVAALIFEDAKGFPNESAKAARRVQVDAKPGTTEINDSNVNATLDRNFFGIPKEGVGISNGIRREKPTFDKAVIEIKEGATVVVPLKYW
jgi:uncharacterized protein (DUF2141 family)